MIVIKPDPDALACAAYTEAQQALEAFKARDVSDVAAGAVLAAKSQEAHNRWLACGRGEDRPCCLARPRRD